MISIKANGREVEGRLRRGALLVMAYFIAGLMVLFTALVMVVLLPIAFLIGAIRELWKGRKT